MGRVVLLSDFGTADGYAAAMAGVIASAAPAARVEHASHDIPPGDILAAALALSRYASLYPPGTVHLVVVDPGVGASRRAIAAAIDGRYYVGPDNGVFTFVLRDAHQVQAVDVGAAGRGEEAAPTFHGRDIFAPVAASLARGEPMASLGPAVADPVSLPLPDPERGEGQVRGEVIGVDRFGNLVTNIPAAWLRALGASPDRLRVSVAETAVGPVRRTYADVHPGQVLALVGSLGLLEISVRDGHAGRTLGAGNGVPVKVSVP